MFDATTRREIQNKAREHGIEPAALLAICDTESAGVAFWKVGDKKLPAARFEGHYFYRLLKGAKRTLAVKNGLASPKAGVIRNPRSPAGVYAMIARAEKIDKDVAHMSVSWGLGQVMGEHWKVLGYKSVEDFVQTAMSGVAGQVEIMIDFIERNGLKASLLRRDWASFARRYNGPAYKKNRYDTKMATAYERYRQAPAVADAAATREVQANLARLGYSTGKPATPMNPSMPLEGQRAVVRFQEDTGQAADGQVGPITTRVIDQKLDERDDEKGDRYVAAGAGSTGASVAGETMLNQTTTLSYLGIDSQVVTWIIVALSVIGITLVCWGLYKKFGPKRRVLPA